MPTIVGNVYEVVNTKRYCLVLGLSEENIKYGSYILSNFVDYMSGRRICPYYFKNKEKVVRQFILNNYVHTQTQYVVIDMPNPDFMVSGPGKDSSIHITRRTNISNKRSFRFIRHIKKDELELYKLKIVMSMNKPLNIIDLDTVTKYIVDNMSERIQISAKTYTNEYLRKNYHRCTKVTPLMKQSAFILKRYKKNEVWFAISTNTSNNTVLAYHLKDFKKNEFYEMLYYIDTLSKHEIYKKAAKLECLDFFTLQNEVLARLHG